MEEQEPLGPFRLPRAQRGGRLLRGRGITARRCPLRQAKQAARIAASLLSVVLGHFKGFSKRKQGMGMGEKTKSLLGKEARSIFPGQQAQRCAGEQKGSKAGLWATVGRFLLDL